MLATNVAETSLTVPGIKYVIDVEFAKDLMEKEGKGVVEATLMAVRMRLRPILMTSLAFILGVLPLAIAQLTPSRPRHYAS